MCVGYLDDRNHIGISSVSFDCATPRSSANRQLRIVAAAPIKSNRPMYSTVIHIGARPDDVVIETIEDPPRGLSATLPPAPGNRRYVTQSVSLLITETRDQSADVRPPRPTIVCGSAEYVSRTRSTDDSDVWHGNYNVDLMTSPTHLFTAALTPVTSRPQVFHS